MREIKFRAWASDYDRHFSWEELRDDPMVRFFDGPSCGYILEQFTGLRDKKGREIYEGDIIKHGDIIAPVRWEPQGMWNLAIHLMNQDSSMDPCEVIGDIHSTPELLK